MIIKEVFVQAYLSLVGHRFRASLTMLGISWGIVAVVLMMAYGNGFHEALMVGFRMAFSEGTVVVWPGQTSMQAGGERAGKRIRMKEDDIEPIRQLGLIKRVSPEYVRTLPITYGNKQTSSAVRGVNTEYAVMRHETAEYGRFFNDEDVDKRRRVAFVGSVVAQKLFGNAPAVGETIRIKGMSFEVVGLMTQKVQMSSYYSPDKYCVFIPYTVVDQLYPQEWVDNLVFQTINPALQERAVRQVREVLGSRHGFDPRDERAVTMNDSVETTKIISGITGGLKVVLTVIGALTLLIGGVGVMNIMLVSVTERTREIGIRKAIGGRRSDILWQFLIEAMTLTGVGGIIGLAVGWLTTLLIRLFVPSYVPLWAPLGGLISSVGIGLIFGLWPAWKAARLDPIVALRYE